MCASRRISSVEGVTSARVERRGGSRGAPSRRLGGPWLARGLCAVGLLAVIGHMWGCDATAARRRELTSSNALDRARAVQKVAASGNIGFVPDLVGVLDDSDQAVRMYAQMALRRLTGEDFGYRYYASDDDRTAAIERWREALRRGSLAPASAPASAPAAGGSEISDVKSETSNLKSEISDPGSEISDLKSSEETEVERSPSAGEEL